MSHDASARSSLQAPVKVATRFGTFEVDPADCIDFPLGLPGFERNRRFAVVTGADLAPFQCLQAVDGEPVSLLVIDPRLVLADYRCVLSQTDLGRLEATSETVLLWLAVVTLEESGAASVNLRAPIVINPERMLGYQVMPHNSLYPLRHPLVPE